MEKLPRCCAIAQTRLIQRQDDLRKVARKAATRAARNRDISAQQAEIATLKTQIEEDKRRIIDHEAEHCADPTCQDIEHYEVRA